MVNQENARRLRKREREEQNLDLVIDGPVGHFRWSIWCLVMAGRVENRINVRDLAFGRLTNRVVKLNDVPVGRLARPISVNSMLFQMMSNCLQAIPHCYILKCSCCFY